MESMRKSYGSVAEMVAANSTPEFAAEFAAHIEACKTIDGLAVRRVVLDLSLEAVAAHMGYSAEWLAELESRTDSDIGVEGLRAYEKALSELEASR